MPRDLTEIFHYHSTMADPPARPWRLGPWVWATQGHFLVAFQDETRDADPTPQSKERARRYLEETPTDLTTVSLAALRAFVGPATERAQCDECDGTGVQRLSPEVMCEHCGRPTRLPCEECGGDGDGGPPMREARIAGVPLNLELLAYALTCLLSDDVLVHLGAVPSLSTSTPGPALLIVGPYWRVAVMSIHEPATAVPVFPVPVLPPRVDAEARMIPGL